MSSSTAAGAVRAGPTSARVSRKTTVSAMAGRVAPARVSVRARASSVWARASSPPGTCGNRVGISGTRLRARSIETALASLAPRRRARSRRPPYPLGRIEETDETQARRSRQS